MTQPASHPSPRPAPRASTPVFGWPAALIGGLFEAQRLQWQTMAAWQQSLLAFGEDAWDRWVCHCGGGAPLDG